MRRHCLLFAATIHALSCTWSGGETCTQDAACFADEQCSQGRCVRVLAVERTPAPPGPLPQELLDEVGPFNGYRLFLDAQSYPLITFSSLGDGALWSARWDGVQWRALEVRGGEPRALFDVQSAVQSASGDSVWLCQSNAAGELWFMELRGGEVSAELVASGTGEQKPNACTIHRGPGDQPLIVYFEGDVAAWASGRATTQLQLALRGEGGWRAQRLSDGWHGYPTVVAAGETTTTIYIGQFREAGRIAEQTRTATLLGEQLVSEALPPLEPLIGRPASPESVAINTAGEQLLAHTRNPGSARFALYLSRRVNDRWRSVLVVRGDEDGDNIAAASIHPHPGASEDATMIFALSDAAETKQSVQRATLLGERLVVESARVEGVEEALTGASAAMDDAGRIHVVYTTAGDGALSYGVLR